MEKLIDPEILDLKDAVIKLEEQLAELNTQKVTLEKTIQEYNHKFYLAVGELLSEANRLRLKKLKAESILNPKKHKEYANARKEYEEFDSQYKKIKSLETHSLTPDEQKSLKTNYRDACKLCHPDSVADEFKDEAAKFFNEVTEAYQNDDLLRVKSILEYLEENKFPKKTDSITDKDRYKIRRDFLRKEVQKLKQEIATIKRSEIYQHITSIGDWEAYFSHIRRQLELEVESLKCSSVN